MRGIYTESATSRKPWGELIGDKNYGHNFGISENKAEVVILL